MCLERVGIGHGEGGPMKPHPECTEPFVGGDVGLLLDASLGW